VGATDDLFQALEWQDDLQTQVHRRHRDARLPGRAPAFIEATKDLVRRVAEQLPPALLYAHADL
jgi:hypothetical protein